MAKAATQGAFADPPRRSVFDGAFKATLGKFPGYLETFERVIDETSVKFTPQIRFFETTEDWAVALQDIYAGEDAKQRLDDLASANTATINT